MYNPKHFAMKDEQEMFSFIEHHDFASLVSVDENHTPAATHLPLLLDRNREYLIGHFAKANNQWKTIAGQRALAIFLGPHSYISSSWYETKEAVPTWNYASVHVYGTMEYLEDNEVDEALMSLLLKYEGTIVANSDFFEGMKKGIVGFKMKISDMQGKAKISQNHSVERRKLVINRLNESEREQDRQIAQMMEAQLEQ